MKHRDIIMGNIRQGRPIHCREKKGKEKSKAVETQFNRLGNGGYILLEVKTQPQDKEGWLLVTM